jgi:transcriptional regulator with XRE-family HTH domain
MGLPHENWRMTTTPVGNAKTLTQLVGTQIRIAMVRQDVRQSQLARAIGKTEQWLSVRLRGRQPIDLNDLALIAQGLGVPIVDLLPDDDDMRSVAASPIAR